MGPANVAPWLEQVGDGLAKKLTWSEVIFSDAHTVLDILRPLEVRDALLSR